MTKRKTYILIGTLLILGVGTYIVVRRNRNNKIIADINKILDGAIPDPSKPQGSGQKVIPQTDLDKLPAGKFPLKIKDKNKKVYELQQILNQLYGSNLDLDGVFGQGLYSVLCDKYWTLCGSNLGYYGREISQKDFDEIKTKKR